MPCLEPLHLVWFKRDLRLTDHAPLVAASGHAPVVGLYVYEPDVTADPEFSAAHLEFVNQSLLELEAGLAERGGRLVYRVGEMMSVLERLRGEYGVAALYAHEETGNAASFGRDERVRRWARGNGVPFHEFPNGAVLRGRKNEHVRGEAWRDGWYGSVRKPVLPPPRRLISVPIPAERHRTPWELGLTPTRKDLPVAGEQAARETLESFLTRRGVTYARDVSSPARSWVTSSHLGPYLAYGNLSSRQVYRAVRQQERTVRARPAGSPRDAHWLRSLTLFQNRLRWREHFLQGFERDGSVEFRPLNRSFEGLRGEFSRERFDAFTAGQTGYPMVDACMRALRAGGWLNFRMRAMLVSFAVYHLWLHWRPVGRFLAREWLDLEPGIHWPQMQMQAGVTSVHTLRLYSPAKQARDHDPDGAFIRRYVPELGAVPTYYLAEPHKLPPLTQGMLGCVIGKHYPRPIVDHKTAVAEARAKLAVVLARPETQRERERIMQERGYLSDTQPNLSRLEVRQSNDVQAQTVEQAPERELERPPKAA